MVKRTNATQNWFTADTMRGFSQTQFNTLNPNLASAEATDTSNYIAPNATGFGSIGNQFLSGSATYIYVAIRRGPMRTPTLGTSVFSPNLLVSAAEGTAVTTGFPVDLQYVRITSAAQNYFVDRLRGVSSTASNSGQTLITNDTAAEASTPLTNSWGNTGYRASAVFATNTVIYSSFRRAPGFFDEVCYTGNGASNQAINHSLGVIPELVIVKRRSASEDWYAGRMSGSIPVAEMRLNTSAASVGNVFVFPVSQTQITVNYSSPVNGLALNASGSTYVAYLFASVPGVSKVGSYTGNGSSQTINCAFTTGARFVLIKRTDSTGDWYVWDSARGIVAGNDPYLALNTTAAEVTSNDSVDTDNTGFIVNQVAASNINVNAATYIFLAIA
jgi:hypothetical protein